MGALGRSLIIFLLSVLSTGCMVMPVETGQLPRIDLIHALAVGDTRIYQVAEILGHPDGTGMAYLPMHEEPREAWVYNHQRGNSDDLHSAYLLLFFKGEVLDGYLWFSSLTELFQFARIKLRSEP